MIDSKVENMMMMNNSIVGGGSTKGDNDINQVNFRAFAKTKESGMTEEPDELQMLICFQILQRNVGDQCVFRF